jgi:hypothetical protein
LEVSVVGRSLGRLVGKKIIEKYPIYKEVHGYQMNDFGAIVAASLAHDIEIHHLAILVKSNWRIFLYGNGKIQGISLCKRVARFN